MEDKLKAPTNTAKIDARELLAEAIVYGPGKAIERQESAGQKEFVKSDTLPTKIEPTAFELLKKWGVKFLEPVAGDPLFQFVELPAGWHKESTDHSMWSKLLDDKGRERAAIFYKAAHYDRRAHLALTPRFRVSQDYERKDVLVVQVLDCGKPIFETDAVAMSRDNHGFCEGYFEALRGAEAKALEWISARYPNWEQVDAYWD